MESSSVTNSGLSYSTALKIAWRESRSSASRFLFVILAVAIGTGSLTGVRGFSRSFRAMLLKDARTLMAADLSVRVFEHPTEDQLASFRSLESRGLERTWITETVSMLSADGVAVPQLIALKAVDATKYPFYGEVTTTTGISLPEVLSGDGVGVSDDLLTRTGLAPGAKVRIGAETFTIRAVLLQEPDRMSGSVNVGPRVMMSRENLERTGLTQLGSRASQRHLFRIPSAKADQIIQQVRDDLKKVFPDAVIADYRETHPLITRGLNNATTFLSLVSLIALVVGALGVAMAMQSHLQTKLDSIAIIKALGGRSSHILRIYLSQTLVLALAGGLIGLVVGLGVQFLFPVLIAKFFPVTPTVEFEWLSIVEGLGLAVLSTLLFTLPTLLGIRQIRPIVILRRDMEGDTPPAAERWKQWRASAFAGLLILIGMTAMATVLIDANWRDSLKVSAWFVGGLTVALFALAGLSWVLLRGIRLLLRAPGRSLPSALRHGLANLYRPGNHAEAVLVALGVGVMFTLTVYLLQSSLLGQIAASAPPGMPNVFVINITESDRVAVRTFLEKGPGVEGEVIVSASASGRIKAIDGKPMEQIAVDGPAKRYLRARNLTWSAELPKQTEVLAGAWWKTWSPDRPEIAVSQETAKLLGIKPGSVMDWDCGGHRIAMRVVAIYRTEAVGPGANTEFITSPDTLRQVPMLYFGAARVAPAQIPQLQKLSFEKFPALTMINLADVLDRVQEVIDQVALVVRSISAFSILAGMIILASSVAGSRVRRIREVVILKTLGATRQRIARTFTVEFLLLGGTAGLMGSLLASAFANLLLTRLLDAKFIFSPWPNLVAVLASALIALAAGWLASFRILGQKPLEILRNE
jgi:putative ABC transport system permease protein